MKSSFRLALMSMSLVSAFAMAAGEIYSNQSTDRRVPALNAQTLTKSGRTVTQVNAALTGKWSEVQNNTGETTVANTSAGASIHELTAGSETAFRLADDFTVTNGAWVVSGVRFFAYRTGLAENTTLPATGARVRIWNQPPNAGNNGIVYSEPLASFTVTEQIPDSPTTTTKLYRIFNTVVPPVAGGAATAPGVTRRIQMISATLAVPQTLPNGTYWVDVGLTRGDTGTFFSPNTTHEGMRSVPGANGVQLQTTGWVAMLDTGQPAGATTAEPLELTYMLTGRFIRDAEGFDVVQGEEFAGDLSSVMTRDDVRHEFFNDASTLACEVIYRGVGNLQGCQGMNIKVELAVARPGLAHEISQFNHATNNFVFLSGAGSTETDSFFDIFVTTNLDGYMQNDLRTKIKWAPINDEDATQDGWTHLVDYVKWEINP
ncbi:MAG TPA: hypothetical protein PKA27_06885 [Fimbriimonadaceae bacterium]|nr:hypothetical protein [Fimbriimonadaceae bacterium]